MKQKGVYGLAGHHDGRIDTPDEVDHFLKGFKEDDQLKQILTTMNQQIQELKKTRPSTIHVQNITTLTAAQLDGLRCGDLVIKQTGTMRHCYTVTYKDETVGGLCLTYFDCENIETVAYEKVEGTWTYQSTDITNIGDLKNKADKALVEYDDVYIGVAAASSTVIDDAYHHNTIVRGRPIAFESAEGYLYVIMPERYLPAVMMDGTEVPMTLDDTTTIGDVTYKIWKNESELTGSFNIYLF